jgi:hypothetical protein
VEEIWAFVYAGGVNGDTGMSDEKPRSTAELAIRALANKYKVAYRETATDILGRHITRLAGDDVVLDEPALMLLALRRAGHITSAEAARLHGDYLRARFE